MRQGLCVLVACVSCASTEGLAGPADGPGGADGPPAPPPSETRAAPSPGAKPSPCKTTSARFCLDFDDQRLGDGWTATNDDASAVPSILDDPTAPSPRFSLATGTAAGRTSWSAISRVFTVQADTLHVEADIELSPGKEPEYGGLMPFMVTSVAGDVTFANYWVQSSGDNFVVSGDGTTANTRTLAVDPPAPRDTWTHASFEIVFARRGRARVSFDGRVVVDQSGVPTAAQSGPPAQGVKVWLGAQTSASYGESALPATRARFDNVQVF